MRSINVSPLTASMRIMGTKNKTKVIIINILKRITQFGFIKSLAGVNCKNCKFQQIFIRFLQRIYKVKKKNLQDIYIYIYIYVYTKPVSYINYIIHKG